MNNKIQMTEEQAREIVTVIEQDYDVLYISEGVEKLKQAGYIIKNPVEEAEEMYNDFQTVCAENSSRSDLITIMDKQHEAIQYLKRSHGGE